MFGRLEVVEKSAEDLVLPAFPLDTHFRVGTGTAGYVREVSTIGPTSLGLGLAGSTSVVPQILKTAYGTRTPTGLLVYLRLRPR